MLVKIEMIDSEIRKAIAWYIEHNYGIRLKEIVEVHGRLNALPGEKPGDYRPVDLRVEVCLIAAEKPE